MNEAQELYRACEIPSVEHRIEAQAGSKLMPLAESRAQALWPHFQSQLDFLSGD
jgi:hypothetical protein